MAIQHSTGPLEKNPPPAVYIPRPLNSAAKRIVKVIEEAIAGKTLKTEQPLQYKKLSSTFISDLSPAISISDYFSRFEYLEIERSCYTAAYIYLMRLQDQNKIILTAHNVHRLLCVSLCLSMKLWDDTWGDAWDDECKDNILVAEVGGFPVEELNMLEGIFFKLSEGNFFITPREFEWWDSYLKKQPPFKSITVHS